MGNDTLFPDGGENGEHEVPPPSTGHRMSDASAASMMGKAASLRAKVYAWIEANGEHGATMDEIEAAFGNQRGWHSTISPRVWELAGKHHKANLPTLIVETDRCRLTRRGRKAAVYVAMQWAGPDSLGAPLSNDPGPHPANPPGSAIVEARGS
jgi:hypothetical protein